MVTPPALRAGTFPAALRIGACLAALAVGACGGEPPAGEPPAPPRAEPQAGATRAAERPGSAASLHTRTLTLDAHVDIPLDFATPAVSPLNADLQVNLEKMRLGGLDAAFFIVYVGQGPRTQAGYAAAARDAATRFAAIHRMVEQHSGRIGLATSPEEVERLHDEGRLAAVIGIENGYVIGRDPRLLDEFYTRGARYMTLVHNGHNDLADSAQPVAELGDAPEEHGGLSELGAEVVRRMNALGIMVDVSHGSKATALAAARLSNAPVIASHSSVRALADHPRNLDDETLQAIAATGGVVQIVAFDAYLRAQPQAAETQARLLERYGVSTPADIARLPESDRNALLSAVRDLQREHPPSTVEDLVDHIDYAVQLIGIDHVGIASDFGGGGGVIGWSDATETPAVTAALERRGYSPEAIAKIWSGNLLRVWREVEAFRAP